MLSRDILFFFTKVLIILFFFLWTFNHHRSEAREVIFIPVSIDDLLPNPFKGYASYAYDFYQTTKIPQSLVYDDVTWRDLEPNEPGVIDWNALEDNWGIPLSKGCKIGFRFKCADPWTNSKVDIPQWLVKKGVTLSDYSIDGGKGKCPDWDNPIFLQEHDRFIEQMGKRYNKDPRVAWIDVGSYGIWGEWHMWKNEDLAASQSSKKRILDAYLKAFPDKKLVIPFDDNFATKYLIQRHGGIRNDCLGTKDSNNWFIHSMNTKNIDINELYKTEIITGEFCDSESGARKGFAKRFELNLKFITDYHWSWIGPAGGSLMRASGQLLKKAEIAYKKMGYRFSIREVRYPSSIATCSFMDFTIKVFNEGVAPFYYPWPVAIALTTPSGKVKQEVTMKGSEWDCRNWLPGERILSAKIPILVNEGIYSMRISIHNPETKKPGLYFAINGRDSQGRYDLGEIAISKKEPSSSPFMLLSLDD